MATNSTKDIKRRTFKLDVTKIILYFCSENKDIEDSVDSKEIRHIGQREKLCATRID